MIKVEFKTIINMKKLNVLLVLLMMSVTSNCQIFTSIRYLDKFSDIVKSRDVKTLITKTDSTFIIEEKGRKPVEYFIINYADFASKGDKDNIVDITGTNVYGYQECWCVVEMKDKEEYFHQHEKAFKGEIEPNELQKYWLFIIHRVISKYSFEFTYSNEFIWVQNEEDDDRLGKDVKRIIYTKE